MWVRREGGRRGWLLVNELMLASSEYSSIQLLKYLSFILATVCGNKVQKLETCCCEDMNEVHGVIDVADF